MEIKNEPDIKKNKIERNELDEERWASLYERNKQKFQIK